MVVAVALTGLLQVGPVILSSGDIGDNYYDAPPPVVSEQTTWLGLFIKKGTSDQETRESHLEVTRVRFVPRKESGRPCIDSLPLHQARCCCCREYRGSQRAQR